MRSGKPGPQENSGRNVNLMELGLKASGEPEAGMSLSFREYLSKRTGGYTPVSLFLMSVRADEEFTAISSQKDLETYLARRKIGPGGRVSAHAIWKNYEAAKRGLARGA